MNKQLKGQHEDRSYNGASRYTRDDMEEEGEKNELNQSSAQKLNAWQTNVYSESKEENLKNRKLDEEEETELTEEWTRKPTKNLLRNKR